MPIDEITRPPFPPFTGETASQKIRMAEDAWNTRNAERVALAYTINCTWRNRAEFLFRLGIRDLCAFGVSITKIVVKGPLRFLCIPN